MAMEATEYAFPFDAEECEGGYDREYIADDFARYFRAFITSGIIADGGNIAESLQVVANDDMTTTLKKGNLIIDGYRYELSEDMIFHHTAADGVLDRIDRISVTLDTAGREIHAIVREGEYSYKPVAPQCRRSSEHLDYVVADVRVVAGAIKITQSNITDTRLSTELCGVAHPFWKLDTQAFFVQLNSFYNEFVAKSDRSYNEFQEWQEDKKAEIGIWQQTEAEDFDTWVQEFVNKWESWLLGETKGWQEEIIDWFNNLREQLTENAAVSLQEQIGNLNHLETDQKEDLVSAINSLSLTYDETMAILRNVVYTLRITLSKNDGESVEGTTVTLHCVDTGQDVAKKYAEEGILFEVTKDMTYVVSASAIEDYVTPEQMELFIKDHADVELQYRVKPLEDFTWEEIAAFSESGEAARKFNIGDQKEFTLTTGEKCTAVIMDFNHDPLASDTTKTVGITFGMLNCLTEPYREPDVSIGDQMTELTENDLYRSHVEIKFYDSLPEDMKLHVKEVEKVYLEYAQNAPVAMEFLSDFVFMLSEYEIEKSVATSKEGTFYPYFEAEGSRIKKLGDNGSICEWLLRSNSASRGNLHVRKDGTIQETESGNNYSNGILCGFCI